MVGLGRRIDPDHFHRPGAAFAGGTKAPGGVFLADAGVLIVVAVTGEATGDGLAVTAVV
jgi:hypothetical protein